MKEKKDPIDLALKKFLTQGEESLNDEEFKCLVEFWSRIETLGCKEDKHIKTIQLITK